MPYKAAAGQITKHKYSFQTQYLVEQQRSEQNSTIRVVDMDLFKAGTLLQRLSATAAQLKAAAQTNEQDKREVGCLVARLQGVCVLAHNAMLGVHGSNNEALGAAVNCTLERIIHAMTETRNVAYRYLASSDPACAFSSAFSRGIEGTATAPAVACCQSQLSQAVQELQSYAHICVSMEAERLASGAQPRMQVHLPDAVNSRLSELHHIATSPSTFTDMKVTHKLAKLVTCQPAEQMDALVKLSHLVNESAAACDAVAAAGGIPFLVDLLGCNSMDAIGLAAGILGTTAYHSPVHQAAIAAAGGVECLVKLLGAEHPAVLCLQGRAHHHVGSPAEQAAVQQLEACFQHCHCY